MVVRAGSGPGLVKVEVLVVYNSIFLSALQ
jgi:hypothetical protein